MWRCLLGCGTVIWDVDQHVERMHPDHYLPNLDRLQHNTEDEWSLYYVAQGQRDRFIEDNFSKIL